MWPVEGDPRLKQRTPEEARRLLSECEVAVTRLKGAGADALTLLQALDRVTILLDELEAQGLDVRPERTRLETVLNRLHREAPTLVRELRAVGGLAKARETAQRPDAPWWHLDERLRAERRRAWRQRLLTGGALVILLAVLLGAGYRWLSERSGGPVQQALINIEFLATEENDPEAALAAAEELIAQAPDEPEAWLWLGVLHTALGHSEQAQAAFDQARTLYDSPTDYLVERAVLELRMGLLEDALVTSEQAVSEAPEAAEAHLILGNVYDALGQRWEALQEFQKADALATEAGQSELAVTARMRIGQMLLLLGQEPLNTVTPQDNSGR